MKKNVNKIVITERIIFEKIVEEEEDKKIIERDRGGLKSILGFIKKIILANL